MEQLLQQLLSHWQGQFQVLKSLVSLPLAGSYPAPARFKPHFMQQRGASANQPNLEQTACKVRSEAEKQLWWGLYLDHTRGSTTDWRVMAIDWNRRVEQWLDCDQQCHLDLKTAQLLKKYFHKLQRA